MNPADQDSPSHSASPLSRRNGPALGHGLGQGLALVAGLSGLAGIVLAALGSHALPLDSGRAIELWRLALQLLFFQVAVTLATVALATQWQHRWLLAAGWGQLLACLLFSGSLMLRALQLDVLPGPFTPLAGGLLILGWLFWVLALLWKSDR